MSFRERREYQPTSDSLQDQLGELARQLIAQVERETGHRVILRPKAPDIHGSYAHIVYAAGDEPHTICILPEAAAYLDYLIGHECGHALRLFAVPDSDRLIAYIGENHQKRATRALVPAIKTRWRLPRGESAEDLAGIYHQGIVGQLAVFPADLRIETWLFEEYPDLRATQEAALRQNIAELNLGLRSEVEASTPPFAFRVQNSLNAAYSTFIARLLDDPSLAEPYRRVGYGPIGEELSEQVWVRCFADYRQDIRDTDTWAKRFGVARWFTWRPYAAPKAMDRKITRSVSETTPFAARISDADRI